MNKLAITLLAAAPIFAVHAYDIHSKALTPIAEKAKPSGEAMAFVKGGVRDFTIIFDKDHKPSVNAAKLLEKCFEKITGTKAVTNGTYRLTLVAPQDPKEQRISVTTTSDGVTLAGNVGFAAVDFAERFLGVRWYFPGENGIIYPQIRDLTIQPVAYEDGPWFEGVRGDLYYGIASVNDEATRKHWEPYCGKITVDDVKEVLSAWRVGGRGASVSGSHSPRPECMAKSHPDELKTIFYTSPYGKFWYNPKGHVGNYFNVLDLKFADMLIEDWKAFFDSDGKDDRGSFKDACWKGSVSFGCCDTYMPISEVRADPIVKELDLIKESDLQRDKDAGMCNIYARFYQYLGNRLKEEMPGTKLGLPIYYNSKNASLDPRFTLPDNIELNVCDGRLPGQVPNKKEMEKSVTLFREWYEASGNRPVLKAWLYAARFNRFGRAVMPEYVGQVPKILGKYLSRKGGVFYDYDGSKDLWHYFYAVYVNNKSQWNPDLEADAAVAQMMEDLYGKEAGEVMTKFHRGIKNAYEKYIVGNGDKNVNGEIPRSVIDELERDLAEAKKLLAPDSVEMKRFNLIADYWPEAFKTQRALADYEPAVYDVKRYQNGMDWSQVGNVPMVEFRTGAEQKIGSSLKLTWDENGMHGRFVAPYAPKASDTKDLWWNDGLELFFAPGLKKEQFYQFAYDCLGRSFAQKQRLLPIPQPPDAAYRSDGFVHTEKITDDGWTTDFFLPWSLFEEGAPKVYDQWNANLVRNKHGAPAEVVSSAFTLGKHANTPMFSILRFAGVGD
ncbi:MAG: hypothetical protein GX174_14995 [Lentisphaerae bacterium]|jgi:hypothetical protein|nr:hypothetical protein [Lentisphaerota bacterium]